MKKILGYFIGGVLFLGLIGSCLGVGEDDTDTATDDRQSKASASPAPAAAAVEPATPLDAMQAAVDETDVDSGEVTQDGNKAFTVTFNVGDNLGNGLIRAGIAIDTFDILKAAVGSNAKFNTLTLVGKFPVTNEFGEESNGKVYSTTFDQATVKRIQFDNIDTTSLDTVDQLSGGMLALLPDLRE